MTTDTPSSLEPSSTMVQEPENGICSQSTSQWTAGVLGVIPCTKDNRLTEATEVTYTTPILNKDLKISGQIAAKILASTTAKELVLSVRITDVAPMEVPANCPLDGLRPPTGQLISVRAAFWMGKIFNHGILLQGKLSRKSHQIK